MTGTKLGAWILGELVGRGPHGTVYRAVHLDDASRVAAVKVLHPEIAAAAGFADHFVKEMLALQRLNHPNIARVYDSGLQAGTAYAAAEFVEGQSLTEWLKSQRTDEAATIWRTHGLSIAVQATRALRHGHHRSLLHRALKPSNLLIRPDGVVKLTDFGAAKPMQTAPLSLPAEPMGTACYLAPEFFMGKPLTRRSDLYALGGVLYTLLCGRPPFAAQTAAEFMHKHCYVLPDRPAHFVTALPPDFDELVCDLLRKDPNRRPQSAPAVLEELDRIRGKAERKGERVVWPVADGDGTATMEALHAETEREYAERPRPLMTRPWVVLPLFALVIAAGVAMYFWKNPSAEELWSKAEPLMASENPADWDTAWDDYLKPLSDRHPGKFTGELDAARRKIDDRKRLTRGLDEGARAKPGTDAEREFQRGLAFAKLGEFESARQEWALLSMRRTEDPESQRWIALAKTAYLESATKPPSPPAVRLLAKQSLVDRIRRAKEADIHPDANLLDLVYRQMYGDEER